MRSNSSLWLASLFLFACGGPADREQPDAAPDAPSDPAPDARADAQPDAMPPQPVISAVVALDAAQRSGHQLRQGGDAVLRVDGTALAGVTGARLDGAVPVALSITARADDHLELRGAVPHGAASGAEDVVLSAAGGEVRAIGALTITPIVVGAGTADAAGTAEAPIDLPTGLAVARAGDLVVVTANAYATDSVMTIHDGVTVQGAGPSDTTITAPAVVIERSAVVSSLSFTFTRDGLRGAAVHAVALGNVRLTGASKDASPIIELSGDAGASVHLDDVSWSNSQGVDLSGASAAAPLELVGHHLTASSTQLGLALTNVAASLDGYDTTGTDVGLATLDGSLLYRRGHMVGAIIGVEIFGEPSAVSLGNSVGNFGELKIDLDPTEGELCIDDARPDRAAADGVVIEAYGVGLNGHELFGTIIGQSSAPPSYVIEGSNQEIELL